MAVCEVCGKQFEVKPHENCHEELCFRCEWCPECRERDDQLRQEAADAWNDQLDPFTGKRW